MVRIFRRAFFMALAATIAVFGVAFLVIYLYR